MDIETEVAGIPLKNPLMNAAGTCKSLEDVRRLSQSACAAIMVGSVTVEARTGNLNPIYLSKSMFSFNSLGLPNYGMEFYKCLFPVMVSVATDGGKPLFVSVAGFTPDEYAELAYLAFQSKVALVEMDLSCPNIRQGAEQKRIFCFDPEMVTKVLENVEKRVGTDAKVSVKLSPFSDHLALAGVAKVISSFKVTKAVTAVNSFPNTFYYNDANLKIRANKGFTGLAGPAIKPIGLGQVRQLREFLPDRVEIIGVGGITRGEDVWEYCESGATAVQVATAYLDRKEKIFDSLLREFSRTVDAKK